MLKYVIALGVFAVILGLVYVRLVPFDAGRFHVAAEPRSVGDYETANSFAAVREITDSQINISGAVNQIILGDPRTRRVAGDLGTAVITYENRSLIFGFPDYATVSFIQGDIAGTEKPRLVIESRARFGLYDWDVNKSRVERWLEELGPLTVAP